MWRGSHEKVLTHGGTKQLHMRCICSVMERHAWKSRHENHLSQSALAWWSQTASSLAGMHVCLCVRVCERERERDPLIYYLKSTVTFRTFSPFSNFLNTYPLQNIIIFSFSSFMFSFIILCYSSLCSKTHFYIHINVHWKLTFFSYIPSFLPPSLSLSLFPILPFSPSLSSLLFFFLVILTLPVPLTNYSLLVVMATSVALSTSLVMWLQMKTPAK